MTWTEEQINNELMRIQQSVPACYRKNLFHRVKKTPAQEFVVKKALEGNDLSSERRKELQLLYDTGQFSQWKEEINEKVWQKQDKYIQKQIDKSIKDGKLPSYEEFKKLPFYSKIKGLYAKKDSE